MTLERIIFAHRGAPISRFAGKAVLLTDNLPQICSGDLHGSSAIAASIQVPWGQSCDLIPSQRMRRSGQRLPFHFGHNRTLLIALRSLPRLPVATALCNHAFHEIVGLQEGLLLGRLFRRLDAPLTHNVPREYPRLEILSGTSFGQVRRSTSWKRTSCS